MDAELNEEMRRSIAKRAMRRICLQDPRELHEQDLDYYLGYSVEDDAFVCYRRTPKTKILFLIGNRKRTPTNSNASLLIEGIFRRPANYRCAYEVKNLIIDRMVHECALIGYYVWSSEPGINWRALKPMVESIIEEEKRKLFNFE
jgi:hypothetical protein